VDYYGRWKALHYAARHFYAPMMVSGLEDTKTKSVAIYLTSDQPTAQNGVLTWRITDLQGAKISDGTLAVNIAPRTSASVQTLDLNAAAQQHGENNLLVWLGLTMAGREVSRNLVTFARPKDIDLSAPSLKTEITESKTGFHVKLSAEKPALWAWLRVKETDARYSDNFVHLDSQTPREIEVIPAQSMSRADFENALVVRSLFDTYEHTA
jgi:beta-mannosidase